MIEVNIQKSSLLRVTLDHNCIVDLEQDNTQAFHLKKLVQLHNDREINLRIVAISACEQKPDHTYVSRFNEFKDRIATIGLSNVGILPTILYIGLGFIGHSLVSGGSLSELEEKIQNILFPHVELNYNDYCKSRNLKPENKKAWEKWANDKCDVLTLWSHIWYLGDIFVTTDNHFNRRTKKPELMKLGAGKILKPAGAVELLTPR